MLFLSSACVSSSLLYIFSSASASRFPVDRRIRRNRWNPQVQVYRMFQGLQIQAPPEGTPAHSQRWAVTTATITLGRSLKYTHRNRKLLTSYCVCRWQSLLPLTPVHYSFGVINLVFVVYFDSFWLCYVSFSKSFWLIWVDFFKNHLTIKTDIIVENCSVKM